jgi:IclR family transcriptional regulator, KDG regulon repressor
MKWRPLGKALPAHTDHPTRNYQVRSVQRALTLLRTFLAHDGELSAAELSKETGLDPSTVFRLLVTLDAQGFVEINHATAKYRPGVVLLELGSRFLKNNDIRSRSIGYLERLRDEFGETVHLTILDGNEVVYLEKLAGLHPIGFMSSRVGDRNPAHCTGVGKALLAYLSDEELTRRYPGGRLKRYTDHTITDFEELRAELALVRGRGYAIDLEEHEVGVKCIAVPTFDHKEIPAAVSVSGPVDRMDHHIASADLINTLMDVAAQISEQMGWGRGVDQLQEVRSPAKGQRTGAIRAKGVAGRVRRGA